VAHLVAIEGIDGSGKGTQSRMLHERLNAEGIRAALIGFPQYEQTLFGRAVGQFLNGRFGALDEVDPFLVSLLYAGDRFESRDLLLEALASNDIVVLDRYVPSNLAHQGAKCEAVERAALIEQIEQIEYEVYSLPRPDLVLLLDLPVDEAQRLIATKAQRSYTDRAADLQEADADYLRGVREVYLELSRATPNWHCLACAADGRIRGVDEIAEEIYQTVHRRGI